jgi:polyisoprenoid-binding protein YceI
MRISSIFLTCITLFLLAACGQGGQSQAPVDGALPIPSGTYAVDKSHTYVVFSYLHQDLAYPLLRATDIDGELELDVGAMEKSTVRIAVAAESFRTNLEYFDEELASRKFFHAEKYPHITFATHSYNPLSDSLGELTGFVTIRDVTRSIVLSVTINLSRSEFGLDRFVSNVGDHVDIRIEAEFLYGSNDNSAAAADLAGAAIANANPASLKIVASSGAE